MAFEKFLLYLVLILAVAKIGGELAERLKQPAVLGELVAGVLVGASCLGACGFIPVVGPALARFAVPADNELLKTLAEIGAVLLLFEAGLECDVHDLKRLGAAALWVACAGVVLPFALGYGAAVWWLHQPPHTALFLGAALTATSVGITARTFGDLKMSERPEAKVVLGAAVADDVLGLIILAVVSGMATTGGFALVDAARVTGLAVVFLFGSLVLGIVGAPFILRQVSRMRTRAALAIAAVNFCFLMAALAHVIGGLAPIVGAFAAGLVLSTTDHKLHFEERIKPVADLFIPVFFVLMGAAMPVSDLNPATAAGRATLGIALALSLVAVLGKVVGGLTVPAKGLDRLIIGVGMVPRGEVGLIFASVGLSRGLLDRDLFTSLVLMVMLTTFVTPPLLKMVARRRKGPGREAPTVEPLFSSPSAHAAVLRSAAEEG